MYVSVLLLSSLIFWACSEDDDPKPDNGKKAKITFSVSGQFDKAEGDYFSLNVGGMTLDGNSIDWKVDGELEKGTAVSVTSDYVDGGKSGVVVESVQNFYTGSVTISSFNIAGDPVSISYKIEANGEVIDEQTVNIDDGDDVYTRNYKL